MPLTDSVDVVVVGGRIAGCATAIRLTNAGLTVALVDRDRDQDGMLSTHYLQDLGLWDDLGMLADVHSLGSPTISSTRLILDGIDLSVRHEKLPRLCVRRAGLDPLLRRHAEKAGVRMITGAVSAVTRDGDGRVNGVELQDLDTNVTTAIVARLVVGADGRNSTIARHVGAERYATTTNERAAYWRYYSNLPVPSEFQLVRAGRDLYVVVPCDNGLTMVIAQPPTDDDQDWRNRDVFESTAQRVLPSLHGLFERAEQVGDDRVVRRMDGYFRTSAGPGWALVGDAGHFKDVVTGQGISDALRQARLLTRYVTSGWRNDRALDNALQRYWRKRDRDAKPMYHFSRGIGLSSAPNSIDLEMYRYVASSRRRRNKLTRLLRHEYNPNRLLGAPAAVSVARALCRSGTSTCQVLVDTRTSLYRQLGRNLNAVPTERERV